MKYRNLRVPLAALPWALWAGLAHAQTTDTPRTTDLGETVVTATRNPQLVSAAMPHTTVITRADIERSQAPDLVTLLQREAGLQRTQNGGVGTVSSVFMRGAPSLQTLVLVDGVPLNKQDASGAVSLEHLMLDNIERVEIVRGNVSAVYGSGAIGGVVQVFTRGATAGPFATSTLDVGAHATRKLSTQVGTQVGRTQVSAGVSRYVSGGFSSINPAQLANANPDADGYRNTSANLAVTHTLAPRHRVGVRVSQSTGSTAYDNAFGAPTDVQSSRTRLALASVFADNTWGDWRSRVSLSEQSDRSVTQDNGLFGSTDRFRTRATVLNWTNTLALSGEWEATAGWERQRQHVDTATTSVFGTPYDVNRLATAVFGGVQGPLGSGTVQFNARHDKVGSLSETTGYLGYALPVGTAWTLLASASTAFSAPPLGYLYGPGFGNPALMPERARSHELGAQFRQGSHRLRATYFRTRVTDQLDYDNATSRFANIGRTQNKGVEVSYQGTLGRSAWRGGLTVQDPVNEITGQVLSRRAKTLWSVGVSHPVSKLMVDADLRQTGARGDRYTDPATFSPVNTTLGSYAVLDVALAYPLSPGWTLRARVDNLTSAHYQTVYGYAQQPRSVYVGVTWRPQR